MKVFLTGASGILGTDIQGEMERFNWEVLGFNSQQINITNLEEVRKKAQDYKPDIIIHSAAMTNVDRCEDEHAEALLANVVGTHNLSLAASRLQVPIVYISSCGVYGNGKTTPYTELDSLSPVNYHHYTKMVGEQRIKEHNASMYYCTTRVAVWRLAGTQKKLCRGKKKRSGKQPGYKKRHRQKWKPDLYCRPG